MRKISYPYIHADCHFWGSKSYYIEDQIRRAAEDHAPQDVVAQVDGRWKRLREYDADTQRRFKDWVGNQGWELPDG